MIHVRPAKPHLRASRTGTTARALVAALALLASPALAQAAPSDTSERAAVATVPTGTSSPRSAETSPPVDRRCRQEAIDHHWIIGQ